MKRSREEDKEEDEKPVKKNRLLNPLIYDQWKEVDRTEERIIYEATQNIGIPIYKEQANELSLQTNIVSKRKEEEGEKGVLHVRPTPNPLSSFKGTVEVELKLPKELPADVKTTLSRLVKDVIGACSADPQTLHPQQRVREVVEAGGKEMHYLYTIDYSELDMVLALPISLPSSSTSPYAADISLISMHDGQMVFTFCVEKE